MPIIVYAVSIILSTSCFREALHFVSGCEIDLEIYPYNEYTYHMIKALEEKNDGLFDYSGKDQEPTWAK